MINESRRRTWAIMKKLPVFDFLYAVILVTFTCIIGPCLAQAPYPSGPDSKVQTDVPHGEMIHLVLDGKKFYPGTHSNISVYVPAQYNPNTPACLCVALDGPIFEPKNVFDNLIAHEQMPITIGIFIEPAELTKSGSKLALRYDRSYEFDSVNDTFDRFFAQEVLPAVELLHTANGGRIRISSDPNDHMIYGLSSGGICAFTAAWQHPELFRRVFSAIGTFVGLRGGDQYPVLIRKTEPKPIRVFLQDGARDTPNPSFGDWFANNQSMEKSLAFAGYDVNHYWGTLGHEGSNGQMIFPDAMRWLWRDYPKPIEPGTSGNGMQKSVLVPGQSWTAVQSGVPSASHLSVSPNGDITFVAGGRNILRIDAAGTAKIIARCPADVSADSYGPDGSIYASLTDGDLFQISQDGKMSRVTSGIHAAALTVTSDRMIWAAEPAQHDDQPSKIWLVLPNGKKRVVDSGLSQASGIVLTADHNLLFAAEGKSHWIYSYSVNDSGDPLQDKQPFYWLHSVETTDPTNQGSGASDMASDSQGNLYVATEMGVQICDRNGRAQAILSLPTGAVSSLAFAGPKFDRLTIISGGVIYQRPMRIPGVPSFAPEIALPQFSGG